jgi:2-oxoglutarate dehydrogenase E1 component
MSFVGNLSPQWIEAQYLLWLEAPERVGVEWQAFFAGFELGEGALPGRECLEPAQAIKNSAVQSLIFRYRDIGHLLACTDPLSPCKIDHPLLSLAAFGLEPADLDRTFHVKRFNRVSPPGGQAGHAPLTEAERHAATLREIVEVMRETYCRSIGVEFMYIQEPGERQWLIDRMEPGRNRSEFSGEERLAILEQLLQGALFEEFLNKKFMGQTRFSLEGGEVLIPLLDTAVKRAAGLGVTDLVLGMPHRGRLNVLANVFGMPLENIFAEFADNAEFGVVGEGDVKYHLGFSTERVVPGAPPIHLTMVANPSHLEAIDPVLEGKCRARQDRGGEGAARRVLPVLIHGDAAFAGQGVVAETFNLSQLAGYRTGGTLHLVLNNQIGFTTLPADARSSSYATDVAKMVMAPIFHVHGEDPEAALHVVRLALDYRQEYGRDVVLEVICYRRHGHNEGDEPYFTQPLMYDKIKARLPVHEIYARTFLEPGEAEERTRGMAAEATDRLEEAFGRKATGPAGAAFKANWSDIRQEYAPYDGETGVTRETLLELADGMARVPEGFALHPRVAAFLQKRREMVAQGEGIDWGTAEALAFATLLREGTSVRLSGQDVRRGTFSQRHGVLFDVTTEETFVPLAGVAAQGARFHIYDSMLSENAVLGFEYGYALESPHALVIWEAQYGDFANGAQVVIDEFIASGETKWARVSGLTLLLPHGFEGHGPDHSSARPERFLQLCADNNMQVASPSTPAQYFHLLRRQMKQPFRKPLIVLTPKSLLRHPLCVSRLDEFCGGRFREVLPGAGEPAEIGTVLLCSGKIYFELLERKERDGRTDLDLIRIEQFHPLRADLLGEEIGRYKGKARFVWVQEEPANMGGWSFIRPYLREFLGQEPGYVGRSAAPSPAVGSHRVHKQEQEKILEEAFRS